MDDDEYSVAAPRELSPNFEATSKWLNCFACCTKVLKVLGHVMILFVMGLVLLSWYAVVMVAYGPLMLEDSWLRVFGGSVVCFGFSGVVFMIIWSYLATVSTDPGQVPCGWHPFNDDQQARLELARLAYSEHYYDKRDPRRPRFCRHCQAWKPERSHHCSTSGHCILKLDHWCVWVINAIGLLNYKFFLLFIFYTFAGSLLGVLLLFKPMMDYFNNYLRGDDAPLVFMAVVFDGAFVVCLAGFLIMHGHLIAANCTTIEMYEKDRIVPWPYNKGFTKNFEEAFGRNKIWWLLPYHTKEEKRIMFESCMGKRQSVYAQLPASSQPKPGSYVCERV